MIIIQQNHFMNNLMYQCRNETWKKIKTLINKNSKDNSQ